MFIHCATQEMWISLTKIVGRPELGADPRYEDRRDRVQFIDEIDAMIMAWTEKRPKHEVLQILAGAGIPCGAVLDSSEVLSDPHLRQTGFITDLEHPSRGVYPMPGEPGAPVRLPDRHGALAAAGRAQRRGLRQAARLRRRGDRNAPPRRRHLR